MADHTPANDNAGTISCDVLLNGQPAAVGYPTDSALAPFVSSGLSIRWGRSTTVDQPQPATCAFALVDLPGDQTFAKLVRTGTRVDVNASATIYPDATVSTHYDPSWTATALGATPASELNACTAQVGTQAGRRSVLVTPSASPGTTGLSITLPPAPFVPTDTAPDAWDTIPTLDAGEIWRIRLSVRLPLFTTGRITPVVYDAPWRGHGRAAAWISAPEVIPGDEGWHTVTGSVRAPGGWLGVRLAVDTTLTWDQAPAGWTWDTAVDRTWDQLRQIWLDDVQLLAPAAGTTRTVAVFSGRVTDITASYEPRVGATVAQVTAQDFTADLANRYVGSTPWPAERADDRINRILTAADNDVDLIAQARPAALRVAATDIDRQAVLGLLQNIAASTDSVLRAATHPVTGPYLYLEDPAARPPLLVLAVGAGGLIQITSAPPSPAATVVPSDLLELEPVTWRQDVADVVTQVTVDWIDQTTTPQATRSVTTSDPTLVARAGSRTATLSSTLTTAADALLIAQQLLARLDDSIWRMEGLAIDTRNLDLDPAVIDLVITLLDGTARIGRPLQLTGLPFWTPAPSAAAGLYLEGGTLTHIDGCWIVAMTASSSAGIGQSVTWDELPAAWTWDQIDPDITWNDLHGVGV